MRHHLEWQEVADELSVIHERLMGMVEGMEDGTLGRGVIDLVGHAMLDAQFAAINPSMKREAVLRELDRWIPRDIKPPRR